MMVVMVLVVEMMMMIPMKSSSMAVTMATISPSGKEFPRQISACRRAFLSLWFSASQRRRNISLVAPPCLGLSGDDICEGTLSEVGQGGHTMPRRGQGWPAPRGGVGPLWPPSGSPSGFLRHLAK